MGRPADSMPSRPRLSFPGGGGARARRQRRPCDGPAKPGQAESLRPVSGGGAKAGAARMNPAGHDPRDRTRGHANGVGLRLVPKTRRRPPVVRRGRAKRRFTPGVEGLQAGAGGRRTRPLALTSGIGPAGIPTARVPARTEAAEAAAGCPARCGVNRRFAARRPGGGRERRCDGRRVRLPVSALAGETLAGGTADWPQSRSCGRGARELVRHPNSSHPDRTPQAGGHPGRVPGQAAPRSGGEEDRRGRLPPPGGVTRRAPPPRCSPHSPG